MYRTDEGNQFLEVTYQNGDKEIMYFKDFASGAMIENIVRRAKKLAIKRLIGGGTKGIQVADLVESIHQEYKEHEDLPNTTNPDDWAKISGKKGERIVYVRTIVQKDDEDGAHGRPLNRARRHRSVPLAIQRVAGAAMILVGIPEPERAELVDLGRTTLRTWGWGDPSTTRSCCACTAPTTTAGCSTASRRASRRSATTSWPSTSGATATAARSTPGFAWTLIHLDLALLIRHLGGGPVGFVAHSFGGGQAGGRRRRLARAGALDREHRRPRSAGGRAGAARPDPRRGPAVVRPHRPGAAVAAPALGVASRRWRRTAKRNNPRLPPEWALHLARHGAREVEGGWVWKADPMFGVGIPSEFNVEMLEAEMRRVRCPVLVLTGDQEDTWRELDRRGARARGSSGSGARHEVVAGHRPLRPHRGPRRDDAPHRGVPVAGGRGRDGGRSAARPRRRGGRGAVARRRARRLGGARPARPRLDAGAAPRRLRPAGPGDPRPLGARTARASWSGSARTPTAR